MVDMKMKVDQFATLDVITTTAIAAANVSTEKKNGGQTTIDYVSAVIEILQNTVRSLRQNTTKTT